MTTAGLLGAAVLARAGMKYFHVADLDGATRGHSEAFTADRSVASKPLT
jgi:hypothetical protein